MERLTVNDLDKVRYDPWELCGMDSYCKKGCHEEGGCTKGCHILKMYRKLAEYENLEEQGKLLKLDFKYQKIMIGQEIFVVEDGTVKTRKICRINEWWNDYHGFQGEYAVTPSKGFGSWEFKYEDFGKTVFLTKEAAEAALKELEEKNGNTSTNS